MRVSKVIVGWVILAVGTGLWVYGYVAIGNPSLVDWHSRAPWWVADFLPNLRIGNRDAAGLCGYDFDLLAGKFLARRTHGPSLKGGKGPTLVARVPSTAES